MAKSCHDRYKIRKLTALKLEDRLLKLYTCIIDKEEIPNLFKLALKIPILKSNKKTYTFDDHRGITLLSSINKVLERIVLIRLKRKTNCRPDPLQVFIKKNRMPLLLAL